MSCFESVLSFFLCLKHLTLPFICISEVESKSLAWLLFDFCYRRLTSELMPLISSLHYAMLNHGGVRHGALQRGGLPVPRLSEVSGVPNLNLNRTHTDKDPTQLKHQALNLNPHLAKPEPLIRHLKVRSLYYSLAALCCGSSSWHGIHALWDLKGLGFRV